MPSPHADECCITRIELRLVTVTIGIRYAKTTLNAAHALVVRLDAGGQSGWGEVFCPVPEPMWAWACTRAPALLGQSVARLDELLEPAPPGRPHLRPDQCGTYFHPEVDAVAEAFSVALHDLLARLRGIPFRELLGVTERTRFPGMPVVGISTPATMAAAALGWAQTGVRHLKIKLGGALADDLAIVQQVRQALPSGVGLQVDANGSYRTLADAAPLIAALNECRIEVIEDLFDIGNLALCRQARDLLHGDYMVDKDAHWPSVRQVLAADAADLINQHPHNQGSMSNAMRIAKAAAAAGIRTAIGSSGIVGIQSAAFQQLAAVIGLTRPCEDVGMMAYYDGPVRDQFQFNAPPSVLVTPLRLTHGDIELTDAPGLGLQVCPDALERLSCQRASFGQAG